MFAVAALLLLGPGIAAAAYPERPIRLISPNPAGGANDTVARIVAEKMAERLGGTIVIDNRGGAAGVIGAELAARAPADGHTLLAGSVATHAFAPVLQKKLPYDPIRDFAPVSLFSIVQNLLVVHPSVAATSVRELVALAKAKPAALNYSSAGSGSTSHFAIALFVNAAGIQREAVHVPYKGGGPAVAATAAGEAQINYGPMPGMVTLVKGGRLRGLAVGGSKRSSELPDVPTMAEAGLPGATSSSWYGLFAPAKTPPAVVAQLHRAVVESVESPAVAKRLVQVGVEPATNTPAEYARFVADQLALHRRIVAESGIRLD